MRPGIVAEWPRTSLTTLTGRNLPKIRRPRAHEPSIINERTNASRAQPIDAKECRPGAATISRYKFRMNRAAITMKSALLGFAALSLCRTSFYLGLPCIRHLRRPVTGADLHGAPTGSWLRSGRLVTWTPSQRDAWGCPSIFVSSRLLRPVAGWDLHPLESAAFARRTPNSDIAPLTR